MVQGIVFAPEMSQGDHKEVFSRCGRGEDRGSGRLAGGIGTEGIVE